MRCRECDLAFNNQTTLTTHLQITGHLNKTGRKSYDCQYCTKKLQSSINLFNHLKNTHLKDGIRDGIICLDETDDIDEEEENSDEDYSLSDMIVENTVQKNKVSRN